MKDVVTVTLDNLVIEKKSPRDEDGTHHRLKIEELSTFFPGFFFDKRIPVCDHKMPLPYDKSLTSLRERGFERHLRPTELFRVVIDALKNPKSKQEAVMDDIFDSYGEWLSIAMLRLGPKLTCYLDPESIVWNPSKHIYEVNGDLIFSQKKEFDIGNIRSSEFVDLNKLPSDLTEFLYTLRFDQLPEIIRSGARRGALWLPSEGVTMPCSLGGWTFCILSHRDYGASRGVGAVN